MNTSELKALSSPRRRLASTSRRPIIDYNVRNENLSKQALLNRGYDQKGWPFAPCGLLTRHNGFDQKYQRLTFCCFKQCLNLKHKALEDLKSRYNIATCPHIHNQTGFTKHMYVKEHPRLVNEIPRGSKRYNTLKKMRPASLRGVGPTGQRLNDPTAL
jgi:hypothetical protein